MAKRAVFASLTTVVFLMNFGRVVFAPLLEPLRAAFGVTDATLGLVATLAWLGSALSRVPTGVLLTRTSRQRVVLVTGGLLTGAALLAALAPTIRWLMVGAFVLGLSSGAYFIAANPLVSELYPERVGRMIGIHGMASQLAAASAGVVVSGALAVGTWQTTFVGLTLVAAVTTVGFWAAARRADLPNAGLDDRDFLGAVRAQYPIVLAGIAIVGFVGFVWNGFFNFYVTYLTTTKGVGESTARTLLTVVFAAGVPAFLVSGWLADRLPLVPYLLAILVGFIGSVLLLTTVSGFLAVVGTSVVVGYVIHSLFPAIDTFLLDSLPDRHRGSAYAVFSGSMMLIQATGSSVLGALVDAGFGFDPVIRAMLAGLTVLVVGMGLLHGAGRFPTDANP